MKRTRHVRWISCAALVLGGYALGGTVGLPSPATAEVREVTPPEAFKSGGARSEIVLKEIAAMLQKMDARLANIEKAAGELVVLSKK
jgi:hypothetical protein